MEPTLTSARLTISVGGSGLAPGSRGMPRFARTARLGGGKRVQDMNLIAIFSGSCFLTMNWVREFEIRLI